MNYWNLFTQVEKELRETAGTGLEVFNEVKLENQTYSGDKVATLWGRAGASTQKLMQSISKWKTRDGWSSVEINKQQFRIVIHIKN